MKETPESRPVTTAVMASLILLLLLGLYVGAYFWSVTMDFTVTSTPSVGSIIIVVDPKYPAFEELSQRGWMPDPKLIFAPMHWIDRRLRPDVWLSP